MPVEERPVIAITMGDAAGIGPEIVIKALGSTEIYEVSRPLVVGEGNALQEAVRLVNSRLELHPVKAVAEVEGQPGAIDLLDLHNLDLKDIVPGQVSAACGKAAVEYVTEAARLALRGEVRAIVTAPVSKEAIKKAGYGEMGHMEILARLTGSTKYATMLVSGPLRVVHLTTHYSLKQACELVTGERVLSALRLTQEAFQGWGLEHPRIAVAALNPHAGEGGLLGAEEIQEIGPAVIEARSSGIDARGPFPADTVFHRALGGEFDVVLAMYHDQGHIPIKVYGFEKSVSVALGLPFVRTSVDHGTAFDIAGKGIASSRSLEEALKVAVSLVREKRLPGSQ